MKIGDKVERRPVTLYDEDKDGNRKAKFLQGTVVYIHSKGRYHTVEFAVRSGTIRESFQGTEN